MQQKTIPARKNRAGLGPLTTLAQHSANHDRSVANAMKYKEDTVTLKEAEKITERACAAVAESAEIPYHLWRNHIEHVIPRIRLPEDWEQRVNPLRNCLLRWCTGTRGTHRRVCQLGERSNEERYSQRF